ncbi:calcium-translocating P-type ATPase [Ceraceosorus guamensis]|uniref:Calcium-translocating P-type ATPase n=1 Tax=Ceraceosorus guamensis TaxID=1522189 RepID=A0A316VYW9_9BASI|nr:calcium-translocating P-type ATPase [Ceraceosorus guamensis]PWN42098.1 calcium-translocating P-type ATPase [Ceraceosorus guamensis]
MTRAGRRKAAAAAIEAEKQRQYVMDPAPFPHRPIELGELVDPKSIKKLRDLGGIQGLLNALGTDEHAGLDTGAGIKHAEQSDDVEAAAATETSNKREQRKPADFVHATLEDRQRVYGHNVIPQKKSKSLLLLMWLTLQDKILIVLCIAAAVSLALGLYTDFGADREQVACLDPPPGSSTCDAPQIDWVEGVAILIAVAIVDIVGSVNDYQKELQFKKLNAKKEERDVKVIRGGRPALMSIHDVVVGDVLQIEPGEIMPADGVLLRGHNIKCDESGATGESDLIRKVPYDEALKDLEAQEAASATGANQKLLKRDCFLISGTRVIEGAGEYVVIAVGPSSFNGKLMMALRTEAEETPLQAKLNRLAEIIAYAGSAAGLLLFIALMIRFFVNFKKHPERTGDERGKEFIDILIIAVTVVVVAVPEGLPLATTLALAFATKRMTKQNLLVRVLGACETMANASVICTDKTGTLTQNEMSIVAGSVGVHLKFAYNLEENKGRIEGDTPTKPSQHEKMASKSSLTRREGRQDWAIDQHELSSVVKGSLRELFNNAITVNSTAFEEDPKSSDGDAVDAPAAVAKLASRFGFLRRLLPSKKTSADEATKVAGFVGSKTETAMLKMAKELGWEDYRSARARNQVVTNFPFSSERKAMAVVVKKPEGGYRLYVKGASEVLSKLCDRHIVVPDPDSQESEQGIIQTSAFNEEARENVAKTIIFYANQMLRTIAICYRDFDDEQWPPRDAEVDEDGTVKYRYLAQDLTLISVVGIEDPLRPGVRSAVAKCAEAGVQVKMCTGDNALTARSIGTQCGIYLPGTILIEGPALRKLTDAQLEELAPRISVLARASPLDKERLVGALQRLGQVVGVSGDGSNDAPALKMANVGFSMGIAGTEVAKEASDIVLMDDNFASMVSAIMWGRCVNDAVRRFLQFQLTVNVGAVLITFISAVASDEEAGVLGAVQLLWLNLIMDTLAALALATDPASPELLKRKPDKRSAPLITVDMWKQVLGQAIYQIILVLVLHFRGNDLLNLNSVFENETDPLRIEALATRNTLYLNSVIFNTFVWCTLFNMVSARSLTRELNFFKGLQRNHWFGAIMVVEVGLQTLITFVGGAAFGIQKGLDGRGWAISIVAGLVTWPLATLLRLLPTAPLEKIAIRLGVYPDSNALPTVKGTTLEEQEKAAREYGEPMGNLAERLNAFTRIRGGRSRLVRLSWKSKSRRMRDADVHPQTLMALVPAIVTASIGAGWRPTNPPNASLADPAVGDPSVSSWQLYQGAIQMHPETDRNDPFLNTVGAKPDDKQQ